MVEGQAEAQEDRRDETERAEVAELDVTTHEGAEGVHAVQDAAAVDVDADVEGPGPVLPSDDERRR